MKLVRSFPANPPNGRNYIVDDAERIAVDNYDYAALADIKDNVIQLDWDTAVSRGDLIRFAKQAGREPGRPLVAPVPIYADNAPGITGPYVWNCRKYLPGMAAMRLVEEWEPDCDLFGFGMVYLPRDKILEFIDTGWHFDDGTFSSWYFSRYGPTSITWDVRPVHIHYRISEVI